MENTTQNSAMTEINSANKMIDPSQVKGWAIDADPENDPTYPMKNRNNGEHAGYTWERPTQQPVETEVLHSNERPNMTAVFGATVPPMGLSGMIRRAAFQYSEDSYSHWVPLMLADRINVFEGVLDDLARGHVPNVFNELGLKAMWQHDRQRLVKRVLIGAAAAGVLYALLRRRSDAADYED